jgi:hypothetical protein
MAAMAKGTLDGWSADSTLGRTFRCTDCPCSNEHEPKVARPLQLKPYINEATKYIPTLTYYVLMHCALSNGERSPDVPSLFARPQPSTTFGVISHGSAGSCGVSIWYVFTDTRPAVSWHLTPAFHRGVFFFPLNFNRQPPLSSTPVVLKTFPTQRTNDTYLHRQAYTPGATLDTSIFPFLRLHLIAVPFPVRNAPCSDLLGFFPPGSHKFYLRTTRDDDRKVRSEEVCERRDERRGRMLRA